MSDELKILIEGLRDDVKLVAEGVSTINDKLDRHTEENKKDFEKIENGLLKLEVDVSTLRKDVAFLKTDVTTLKTDVAEIHKGLNEHRNNTELHTLREEKAS